MNRSAFAIATDQQVCLAQEHAAGFGSDEMQDAGDERKS